MSPNYVVLKCIINLDYFYLLHFTSSKPKNHFLPSFKFITLAIYMMEGKKPTATQNKKKLSKLSDLLHTDFIWKNTIPDSDK